MTTQQTRTIGSKIYAPSGGFRSLRKSSAARKVIAPARRLRVASVAIAVLGSSASAGHAGDRT